MSSANLGPPGETPIPLERLATPAQRALTSAGFETLEQLSNTRVDTIAGLHGIGGNALKTLREALAEHGKSFWCD